MHHLALVGGTLSLLALGCGIGGVVHQRKPGQRLPGGLPVAIGVILVSVGILASMVAGEISLQQRDAAITAQLATAGIQTINTDESDNGLLNVKAEGCTATFQIKQGANPGAWPLIPDTGKVVSGCDKKNLNRLFIRP